MSDCTSLYGRLNKLGDAASMLQRWATLAVPVSKAEKMSAEELEGKVIWGEFINTNDRPEYTEKYAKMIAKAQEA